MIDQLAILSSTATNPKEEESNDRFAGETVLADFSLSPLRRYGFQAFGLGFSSAVDRFTARMTRPPVEYLSRRSSD